ncbi:MAG: acyl-CoA thioesterase [Planctomycetes bacterium]|nr:acyl-CoA thioesterase [Planctomycetota bacterium]
MSDNLPGSRYLALKALMMPRETNAYGTIFGGVLLSYIDQAGAVGAHHAVACAGWPQQPLVTVAMNRVEFHQPVYVGDLLSFWTEPGRVGTTSITIHVIVEAEREGKTIKVTEADVTFVAIEMEGESRRPVPVRGE